MPDPGGEVVPGRREAGAGCQGQHRAGRRSAVDKPGGTLEQKADEERVSL